MLLEFRIFKSQSSQSCLSFSSFRGVAFSQQCTDCKRLQVSLSLTLWWLGDRTVFASRRLIPYTDSGFEIVRSRVLFACSDKSQKNDRRSVFDPGSPEDLLFVLVCSDRPGIRLSPWVSQLGSQLPDDPEGERHANARSQMTSIDYISKGEGKPLPPSSLLLTFEGVYLRDYWIEEGVQKGILTFWGGTKRVVQRKFEREKKRSRSPRLPARRPVFCFFARTQQSPLFLKTLILQQKQ